MLATTIPAALFGAADRFGDATALVDDDGRISFAALGQATRRAAKAFMAAGIGKGDAVGVWAPNMWQWVAAAAGAQAAGGVLVPLNTRMRGREVAAIVNRARIRILVSIGEFLGCDYPAMLHGYDMPGLQRIVVLGRNVSDIGERQAWERFLAQGEQVPDAELEARLAALRPDDLADIMFTSGTTGEAKGALFNHRQSLLGAETWLATSGVSGGDRYMAFGPFSHTASYKAGWVAALLCGCTLYGVNKLDPLSIMALIGTEKINFMPAPPTILQTILTHPRRPDFDLSSLEFISTGAAVVPIELVRRLKLEVGVDRMATGYGLTECCGTATSTRPEDSLEIVANTAGRAAPGIEVCCVRPDGGEAAPGEPGEVLVRAAKVTLGYLDNPKATAEAIDKDGWLHTGDIGTLDEAGNLKITDRLKDMYIVGGFNCYPAEIERDLAGLPGVMHCAVIGVPDERLGEVGRAYIVRAPESTLTEAEVAIWCKQNLANYKAPRSIVFVESLPLNASGKVMKHELRAMA
ncbi:MAG TPA: AMP-binding protein [Acetobacteraceae bacterium]|nr:AMP-binding protein [Acetobacteraceae bacterium]